MSSLEMTGVMGILAAWEMDGWKAHHGLNAIIMGSFNQEISAEHLPPL